MKHYFLLLVGLLLLKALLLGLYIHQGMIGLGPDEAQYWTWSRMLDWGYYSKPPGIALQIWLGTYLLGGTELGVRLGSLVMGTLLPLAVYSLALAGGLNRRTAFWSALIMAFSPMGMLATLFAITDVGMVLSWTLAAYPLIARERPNYLLAGLIIAFGALFKWPIYFFWAAVLAGMILFSSWRRWSFFGGVALSLLGVIPVWIWNVQHDWVTFRHVGTTMVGGHGMEAGTTTLMRGNVLDFLGAQALLLSPILFVILICVWIWVIFKRNEAPSLVRWGSYTSFMFVGTFLIVAIFQKMQGNWCIFAYPLAIPAIAWLSPLWTRIGVGISILLVSVGLVFPMAQKEGIVSIRANPFKHNLGWEKLAPLLIKEGYSPDQDFLFAESYQMTSILSFYGPAQKRAYFFNLAGMRHNQFDLWPGMDKEQKGKTGYFLQSDSKSDGPICDQQKQNELKKYFNDVECLGVYPLIDGFSKYVRIWKCSGYNGKTPAGTIKY